MEKFMVIGERIHCISPTIRKALDARDPEPILKRAKEQIEAGAAYLDVNIGPAEKDGEELMQWVVELIQSECDNVPLALDTANKKAIEAGIKVYNRSKGKPIVNSADAGERIDNINLAAANDAMVIALCASEGIPADNDERMMYCQQMLERAMEAGMEPEDLLFDPLFLVIKGMQEKQVEVLEAVRMMSEMGLKTTGGLSNVSNGAPKELRPVLDAYTVAMAMMCGLTSAIANPCDKKVMEAIKTCDMILGKTLYADSFLEL
jgi:5-methyltetrahydrofolate corrinoid/iron sulfur protein methyltransferase